MKSWMPVAALALSLSSSALAQAPTPADPGTAFWINVQRGGVGDIGTLGLGMRSSWRLWREQTFSVHARAGADVLMFSYLPLFDLKAELLLSKKVNGWNVYVGPQLSWLYVVGVYGGGLAGFSAPISENWAVHVEGDARYPLLTSSNATSFSGQLGWGVRVGLNTRF